LFTKRVFNMQQKTLLDYWIVLYKKKKAIAIITVISVITVIILSEIITPVYESKAVFYIPVSSQALSYLSTTAIDDLSRDTKMPTSDKDAFAPYIGMLKSRKIAERVHHQFPQKKIEKLLHADIDFELSNEFMINVYSRDTDPVLAADVANSYVDNLNILLEEASSENLIKDIPLIEKQMTETEKKLINAEDALKSLEENSNIASIDEEIKNLTVQRISFQDKLESTDALIKENEERIISFSDQLKKEQALYSEQDFSLFETNPLIEHLQKSLSDLSAQIASTTVDLKESHPDVVMLKRQYAETEEKLKKEIQHFISSQIKSENTFYEELRQNLVNLLVEKNGLQALKKGYSEATNRVNERLKNLPSIKTEWNRLNEETERHKRTYEQLERNLEEAKMQHSRQMQFVVVVDSAKPQEDPSFPILWLNILVALICGPIAGVLYAFFSNYIEETRKVRTRKIIKELLSKK
ncbi:hypothetical protein KY328_00260, partial [Candidatus Woesearchaeota archaeon]|nr:hypothetical protein [Candidatus Woesearchaeota archaeon]